MKDEMAGYLGPWPPRWVRAAASRAGIVATGTRKQEQAGEARLEP